MKKFLALLLVAVVALCLVACGNNEDPNKGKDPEKEIVVPTIETGKDVLDLTGLEDYDLESAKIYNAQLGVYYDLYQKAKAEKNVSKKWALMAQAEAKLLESGIMLPLSSNGGNYAIGRVAPYTATPCLWGNDSYRYHQIIALTDYIKPADRDALKALWKEKQGTGTWEAECKKYLADKGYTTTDEYKIGYSSDPKTWDTLATSRAADSEAIVNTYDGLMEYNLENVLAPALAESYEVSTDGKTYTFKLREGVMWVDSQGNDICELTAEDFVAGMQHMCDAVGGLEYLIQGIIVNASEYIDKEVTDFTQVGVKAVDKYKVQYTLCDETSFFLTMLGYGVFAPLCKQYYESKGGKFGAEYDAAAETYLYGKTPDAIAYCGPYLVSESTAESTIKFVANPKYWNKDNINIKTITWLFNDGKDPLKGYNDMKAGVLTSSGLNTTAVEAAKKDGLFDQYAYTTGTDATSFMAFFNLNRELFANVNDDTKGVSAQTDAQKEVTNKAMSNVYFRLALCMALDRSAYNAQTVGDALKLVSLRNCYTPGTFVKLEEDVTIAINGKDVKFAKGTYYGAIMQAQIDADGVHIKVWDKDADKGIGSSDGFDGWYNPDAAVKYLEKALEELNIEATAENPIQLDLPTFTGSPVYKNRAAAFAQSVAKVFGGKVKVNCIETADSMDWYMAGYYTDYGYEANYDIYDVSGWGPDYGDPSTYLDTFLPEYAGYMVKCIGIY